ncbi:MAG TPA: redoxin domain-containing protein [Ferruginibacter sp.]|nr:redoxin domain-containing protein [Ferruginibacter sp.]HMP21012.1 redoxin domain-containing protein [Ferruginibacter sp.]
MPLHPGDIAPSFALYDTNKNKVQLEDFKGKNLLLLFFPLAFTSVCTKELCSTRDNIALYNNFNAEVVALSVDSLQTLDAFKKSQQLNFTLLSDFNKEASAAYGALYDIFPAFEYKGVSRRAAFVIDAAGFIRYAEVCASPGDLPDFEAIQKTLSGLI